MVLLSGGASADGLESPHAGSGLDAAISQGRLALASLVRRAPVPALSVAVAIDGEIVWAEAFGIEAEQAGQPGTVDAIGDFDIFTGAVDETAPDLHLSIWRDFDGPTRSLTPSPLKVQVFEFCFEIFLDAEHT